MRDYDVRRTLGSLYAPDKEPTLVQVPQQLFCIVDGEGKAEEESYELAVYTRFNEQGETVASVDGHDISKAEWDQFHQAEVQRRQQEMPGLDVSLLNGVTFYKPRLVVISGLGI